MYSTVAFAALRFVSRNVGRCLPRLYRYDAETVMSEPTARSIVSSAMLISGRSIVGDRYWIDGFAALEGCDVNTFGYCGAPADVGVKLYEANVTPLLVSELEITLLLERP